LLSGFEVFQHYVALKSHFNTPSYDYIKYRAKTTVKRSSYEKRNDKAFFERLANRNMDYIIPYLVANFVENENLWVGDLTLNQESEEIYFAWRKRMSRLFTTARSDMENIRDFLANRSLTFNDLFVVKEGSQPIIFRLLVQRYITLETYIIMDTVLGFSARFDRMLKNDYIYEQWSLKIKKYAPFLNLDKAKCHDEVKEIFLKS